MSPAYRRLLKLSRLTHLYLTLFGLVLILFFAATGFMLNHEDWFLPSEARMPSSRPRPAPGADRLDVSESVRRAFGVGGEVKSYRADGAAIEVEYKRAGERALLEVRRTDGHAVATTEARGWVAVAVDLHKGKDSGRAWAVLIDAVCVVLVVISATGLVLCSSLKSRGRGGLVLVVLGAAA
jgi:hypothetical protein